MYDALKIAAAVASSGLAAQSSRLRIISENLANVRSTAETPNLDPYRRKTISFAGELDRASGAHTVKVREIGEDSSPFKMEFDPGNPAADEKGFVKTPNVDVIVEMADMREANRSYEANLQVARQAGELMNMTVNLLKDA